MLVPSEKVVLGLVPSHRGFFSAKLAADMRKKTIETLSALGFEVVVPSEDETKMGCVESLAEARLCANLFAARRVDGIVVGAMNFGDEQAAALAIRDSRLDVPVFLFGCQEEGVLTPGMDRRDSFCGLLSLADGLRQLRIRYTLATHPICMPTDESFRRDVDAFGRMARVLKGIRRARYGQIGTRPEAFWTCRYDERTLQALGPTVVTIDMSQVIAGLRRMDPQDPEVRRLAVELREYANTSAVGVGAIEKIATLECFLRRFREEHALDALAIQCWLSIQENFGICACTVLSRLGEAGIPCACETDVLGALSQHALQLASGGPATLLDWNNLHSEDPELVNVWHCGVMPKSFAKDGLTLGTHGILVDSGAARAEDAQGVATCIAKDGPVTLARVAEDDGVWKAVLVEGCIESNRAATTGSYGWCRIRHLDRLYREVLLRHFPHHVAMTQSAVAGVLWEAFGNYLGFEVYHAAQDVPGKYLPRSPF
jgi:L-fucose isomerase-like protein